MALKDNDSGVQGNAAFALVFYSLQNPKSAVAWYGKGLALKLIGSNTEADEAFAKARS